MSKDIQWLLDRYSIVLIGDGSGINEECAWSVLVLDQVRGVAKIVTGYVSESTINVAELIGYIHVLNGMYSSFADISPKCNVAIITDSLLTANIGNGEWEASANLPMWKAMDALREVFTIDFIHIDRCSIEANAACDKIAGELRKAAKEVQPDEGTVKSLLTEKERLRFGLI